jgi:hypothetical protein
MGFIEFAPKEMITHFVSAYQNNIIFYEGKILAFRRSWWHLFNFRIERFADWSYKLWELEINFFPFHFCWLQCKRGLNDYRYNKDGSVCKEKLVGIKRK